jgi:ubiquitin-like 1-activating enzyme E1 B
VLEKKFEKCQNVYMRLGVNPLGQIFVPEKSLEPPNPNCYVCADKPEVTLKVDTGVVTVKELRDEILIKAMNMVKPDVMLDGKGIIVISSDEDETEDNEEKLLKDLFIVDGCILKVDDFFQNYELTVTVIHKIAERDEPRFEVVAGKDVLKPQAEEPSEPQPGPSGVNGSKTYESDDDDCVMCEEPPTTSSAEKRKFADEDEESPSIKRPRIETPPADDDDDLICID